MLLDLPTAEIEASYLAGETLAELATAFDCSEWTIKHRLRQQGVKLRRRGPARTYTLNEAFFDAIETEAPAYWLGFLLADARVSRTVAGNWVCRVDLGVVDRGHLEKLRDSVGSNAPLKPGHDGESVYIDLCSVQLCRALLDLECGPDKTGKHGTPAISEAVQHHFYRGFSDGDGSLFYMPQIHAWRYDAIWSPRFITAYQQWLIRRAGVSKTKLIVPKNSPTSLCMRWTGGPQIVRICDVLYAGATVFLDRKFEKYNELCN